MQNLEKKGGGSGKEYVEETRPCFCARSAHSLFLRLQSLEHKARQDFSLTSSSSNEILSAVFPPPLFFQIPCVSFSRCLCNFRRPPIWTRLALFDWYLPMPSQRLSCALTEMSRLSSILPDDSTRYSLPGRGLPVAINFPALCF